MIAKFEEVKSLDDNTTFAFDGIDQFPVTILNMITCYKTSKPRLLM